MKWGVADIETTIFTSFKRKANPFDDRNWVVMAGWCTSENQKPAGIRMQQTRQDHQWFRTLLQDIGSGGLLVGANIKFDLLHILKDNASYGVWMDFVANGGNVWDVQLAEYLLDGQVQSSHMLSLDDLCMRYGLNTKVDEVKKLWAAGVPTDEIDPDLLSRYLLGEDLIDPMTRQPTGQRREGDIGNTREVFKKQVERARKSGQSRSILMNMGSLLATIEKERNGMFVNLDLAHKLAEELHLKLVDAKRELEQYLPADLPFEFNWTNRYHLSPLIFGGKVKYECRQYDLKDGTQTWIAPDYTGPGCIATPLYAYAQKDEVHYVLTNGTTFSVEHYPVHIETEPDLREKYKGGKNAGEYKTKKVKVDDYTKPKSRMADRFFEFPGFTQPRPEWASSTEGLYSVAEEVIEELTARKDVPFLVVLGKVTKMNKDLTTYFITEDPETHERKGMLTLVQPDSIIHHSLNHTSTVTGRFSSSNPNLQNIPKGNKSAVKTVFESRFGADGYIVQSDFSSLEVYVQANLTHCSMLVLDLRNGVDMHVMRLSIKENMPYDEVYARCKGDKYSEEWDYKRTDAKVFSFQRAYGAGNAKIAASTGMKLEDVEALAEAEEKRYPEISAYFEKRAEEIRANRQPTATHVPHPSNPAIIVQLGISRVRTPDGKLYTYREHPSMDFMLKRGVLASFMPTEIKNYEVQGEGGEWMKAAMWLAVRAFYARRNFGGHALLVNTVHDAMYIDAHKDVRVEAAALLHACMEAASDFMEWYFKWPIQVPVPSDTVWGRNMGEENKFTEGEFKEFAGDYRLHLRNAYMQGYQPSYLKENT
jgi:DNA polymerase-1